MLILIINFLLKEFILARKSVTTFLLWERKASYDS